MRDKQAPAPLPSGRIPVVSPVLHFLSMPVLVFWRYKFGYAYLSPKSVFLATIFASCLFSYMVWHEPKWKAEYFGLAAFGSTASALYLIHLITAVRNEVRRGSEHDQYSGSSRLLALVPATERMRLEGWLHGLVEPALTMGLGCIMLTNILGKFLVLSGVALVLKELIRSWLGIRGEKRVSDSMTEAKDLTDIARPITITVLPTAGRTEQETYSRRYTKDFEEEARYAEVLRLLPPYTLDSAEINAAKLIKNVDPISSNAKEQIRRINEALEYFRSL